MKINNVLKLKAHTLLSALIISIIISIILSSLLLVHYHNNTQWIKYKAKERLQRNLQSAINLVIGDSIRFNEIGEEKIDLFGDNDDSVIIIKEYWGVFNLARVKSFNQYQSLYKQFFYGTELTDTLSGCLFLVDHQRPLQISGKTRLVGDAYLPKGGIKTANIDGNSYDRKELVYGNILKSDTVFTSSNRYLINKMYELLKLSRDKNFQNASTIILNDSIYNSFENEIQYYFISGKDKLTANSIKGKVILFSNSVIEIRAGIEMKDVIIIAPEISIGDNFEGSVQLIANKAITIGKNCKLNYPSSILLLKDSVNNYQGKIEIADNTIISGLLFANAAKADLSKNIVDLGKGSVFEGIVCVKGYLQSKGMVYGTVITDYFLYKSVVTTYENSLVDAVIDRTKLSPYFISSTLIKLPGKLKVMKWLK